MDGLGNEEREEVDTLLRMHGWRFVETRVDHKTLPDGVEYTVERLADGYQVKVPFPFECCVSESARKLSETVGTKGNALMLLTLVLAVNRADRETPATVG